MAIHFASIIYSITITDYLFRNTFIGFGYELTIDRQCVQTTYVTGAQKLKQRPVFLSYKFMIFSCFPSSALKKEIKMFELLKSILPVKIIALLYIVCFFLFWSLNFFSIDLISVYSLGIFDYFLRYLLFFLLKKSFFFFFIYFFYYGFIYFFKQHLQKHLDFALQFFISAIFFTIFLYVSGVHWVEDGGGYTAAKGLRLRPRL